MRPTMIAVIDFVGWQQQNSCGNDDENIWYGNKTIQDDNRTNKVISQDCWKYILGFKFIVNDA